MAVCRQNGIRLTQDLGAVGSFWYRSASRYRAPVTFNAVARFVAMSKMYSLLRFGSEPHLEVHFKNTAVLPSAETARSVA